MVLKILSLKGTEDFTLRNVKDAVSICQELVKFLPLQIRGYDIINSFERLFLEARMLLDNLF